MKRSGIILIALLVIICQPVNGQASKYFGEKQKVPVIPPKEKRMKVIIVSDAANEIDDVWAIALAILYPERFEIEGFIGSNFDHTNIGEGPESIKKSVNVIRTVLIKAGMKDKYPVYPGGNPMQYEFYPSGSEGVDFIIRKAMACSPEDPLWIICLGAPTDPASAYLKQPAIRDRVFMFWHARTEETWPYRAHNYNIKGDMHASRMMFHAPFPLVLFDTGTQLNAGTLKESKENIKPYGELGEYLYDYRLKSDYFKSPTKGYFDIGDIAVLIDSDLGKWETIPCPTVTPYMDYNFYKTNGRVLRCYGIDRNKAFRLLYSKLKSHYNGN